MAIFPQYVLYFLYVTFNMDLIFDWDQVISNQISHQLPNYKEIGVFFMAAYLVYVVIYNFFVTELSVRKYLDVTVDPIQFCYPTLWKHKVPYFIYQFHDAFLRRCREIFKGESLAPVTKEAIDFLIEKWKLYIQEEHTYFRIYGFEGIPFLLPIFLTDRLFI